MVIVCQLLCVHNMKITEVLVQLEQVHVCVPSE